MMADKPHSCSDDQHSDCAFRAVNDNGTGAPAALDPRLLTVARAIGKQMAREQLHLAEPANDNDSEDAP